MTTERVHLMKKKERAKGRIAMEAAWRAGLLLTVVCLVVLRVARTPRHDAFVRGIFDGIVPLQPSSGEPSIRVVNPAFYARVG